MSEDYLIRNCAPTLAGLKTASLFTCPFASRKKLLDSLRQLNRRLGSKGLRLLPLRFSDSKALIYLYRPEKLRRDLSQDTAAQLLRAQGYDPASCEKCVRHLACKLRRQQEFPHEIGLFLGYPPADVCGFIEQGPDCCKCTGCWKVYSDVEGAQKKFAQYKKCTRVYQDQWAKGKDIERLTVAG
ncbi:MAG: DUF3793 family protein [Oscillospiraceae bacterium]|nr:DUF3793 family protein [Oscillospiraceae bacterium]